MLRTLGVSFHSKFKIKKYVLSETVKKIEMYKEVA